MAEKYTYYADFGSGYEKIEPLDINIKLVYELNHDWEGIYNKYIDGDFKLTGSYFDIIDALVNQNGNPDIPFRIYENGDSITGTICFEGIFNTFNDFNYNEKTLIVKNFICTEIPYKYIDLILNNLDKTFTPWDLYYHLIGVDTSIQNNLTPGTYSHILSVTLQNLFDAILPNIDSSFEFDENNCWYSTEQINIKKISLAPMTYYVVSENEILGPEILSGPFKFITLEDVLKLMQNMFRAYWYIDYDINTSKAYLKFKKPSDFIENQINLESYLEHSLIKYWDIDKNYQSEIIDTHSNDKNTNPFNSLENTWLNGKITYNRTGQKNNVIDLSLWTTKYERGIEQSADSWYVAYIDPDTRIVEYDTIYGTTREFDNAMFSPSNIANTYYRDYLYTKINNYSIADIASTDIPTHYKAFINMAKFEYVLSSINICYDSIRFKYIDENHYLIARMVNQQTDLKTNITIFDSFEFFNSISTNNS